MSNLPPDIFHEAITDEQLDRLFAVMALNPDITYRLTTAYADRASNYCDGLTNRDGGDRLAAAIEEIGQDRDRSRQLIHDLRHEGGICLPLPNVQINPRKEP